MNEVVNLLNFFHDKHQKNLDILGNPTDGNHEEQIKNTILHELTSKLSFLIFQEDKYCGISNLHFEWVDGYKIVSRYLTERNGYQYEIGKKEYFFNIPVLHNNSFHFYRNLTDCFSYEDLYNGNRLFRVNAFVLKDDNGNLVNYEYYFDYDPYGMPIEKTRKTLNGDQACAAIILLYEEIDASAIYLKNIQEKFHFLKNLNIIYEEIKDYSERDVDKYLITNLQSLTRLKKSKIQEIEINKTKKVETKTKEYNIIVSALRLDNVIAELAKVSRTQSKELIEKERIFINFKNEIKSTKLVNEGDLITIRGKGRFKISEIIGNTQKGKYVLKIEKYV